MVISFSDDVMKFGSINLKTKIEIGLIFTMIVIASVCSVSSLLSITDDNITDSTHGIIIDFDNASAFFTNMTTENATFTQNVTFNRPFSGQVYNQAIPPDIPAGTIAWWLNSTDGNLSVVVDIGGAQYYICNGTGPGGGVYIAGNGLNLTGATFSFDGLVFDENLSWDGQYLNATDIDTTYSSGTGINITGTTFSFNGTYGNAQYLQHALFDSNGLIKRTGAGTYSIITDNSANWNTAHGWNNHAIQNYLDDDVADDVDDADIDWGSGAGQVNTDDVPEGSTNFWCDLARIQSLLTNDFHNIGGVDDDVPESGDFGAAGDLNADGTITDGSVSESNLDIDNAPTDEHVLTWESSSGKMHWQVESPSGSGYHNNSLIWNTDNNSWLPTGANIQLAINDLTTGTVQLPAGEIELTTATGEITFKSGIHVVGAGRGITTIKFEDGADFTGEAMFFGQDLDNISVRDLTLDANGNSVTASSNTMDFKNCDDILISNVDVINSRGTGFCLVQKDASNFGSRFTLDNCRSFNNGIGGVYHGFILDGDNITATNCEVDGNNGVTYLGLDVAGTRDSTFTGWIINDCVNGMKVDSTTRSSPRNVFSAFVITKCTGTTSSSTALALTGGTQHNSFDNFMLDNVHVGIGIWSVSGGAQNNSFNLFKIYNSSYYAIGCFGNNNRFTNIEIDDSNPPIGYGAVNLGSGSVHPDGCYFSNIEVANTASPDDTVVMYGATNIDFLDSKVYNNPGAGMKIMGGDNITISGCNINNNLDEGIWVTDLSGDDVEDLVIRNNDIKYNGETSGHDGVIIDANDHERYYIYGNFIIGNAGDYSIDDDATNVALRLSDVNLSAYNFLDNGVG